ncbi:uncharacterized protein N7511_005639, partial [Penicillium nucicola]|uniref:uncharacterized protein n=1 Tax=Penicillium nucicola TaxID=1850975 RepID=UPI0025457B72
IRSDQHLLQDIVTWDEYSIFIHGERVLFLSGEFHPFRLPSPGLWLDVFQKIKALGFSGVSFYTYWGILEGEPGVFRDEGVFALETFFEAASQAGIYLLARPGPYINSETSGGGFPGWGQRVQGPIRSNASDWLEATQNYITHVGSIISKAQITNGGPIVLVQPENEYTLCDGYATGADLNHCLNPYYMNDVESMWRATGITVPFISNDATPVGDWVPGSGIGEVNIYGFDSYPVGWGNACSDPETWERSQAYFPSNGFNHTTHMEMSPGTPMAIVEYQGGASEGWGGAGMQNCAALVNEQFERIYYKAVYAMRTTFMNLYMVFGGTNWGNIGHPLGYTSYDVGAAISEDRQVTREKYSELKLQAGFLQSTPSYLTMTPENGTYGVYTNTKHVVTTRLIAKDSQEALYIVRQTNYSSFTSVEYTWHLRAEEGNIVVPQLGGSLALHGRDSKIMVANYKLSNITLIYSSAEIATWRKSDTKTVLVLYGGENELHEFALPRHLGLPTKVEGQSIKSSAKGSSIVIQWNVQRSRCILHFGSSLEIHLLWRNEAYNYWTIDLPRPSPVDNFVSYSRLSSTHSSIIVKAGYLMRNASVVNDNLMLYGDVNATTSLEVILAPISKKGSIFFNDRKLSSLAYGNGRWTGTIKYSPPSIALPDLSTLEWRFVDSLPEISADYNDALWPVANYPQSNNTYRKQTTPTSLFASDYGFHSGSLFYRGHFTANGKETTLFLNTSGGNAFAQSVWLNATYLGSWIGDPDLLSYNQTLEFPKKLVRGQNYVVTVLIDHMGLTENFVANLETMKEPRGILDYSLGGHDDPSDITWKLTGNLGGEHYLDISRGPRNEGAHFAERQGYHLPGAPISKWKKKSPFHDGLTGAGVGFFATSFELNVPVGYDVPMSFVFANTSSAASASTPAAYRIELFVNGWQYGKYVNNLGPQTKYPVPEGILNYEGTNYIALVFWSLEDSKMHLGKLSLVVDGIVESSYSKPAFVDEMKFAPRSGAY